QQPPLPVDSDLHVLLQSGLPSEPSSHCSPLSMMPSPHIGSRQSVRHTFGTSLFDPPLSHCSVGAFTPSPHTELGFATMHTSSSCQPPNCRPGSLARSQRTLTLWPKKYGD